MATSWSNLHTSKLVQPPAPSQYTTSTSGSGSGKKTSQARAKLAAMSMSVPPTPMREVPDPILSHPSTSKKNSKNTNVDFDMSANASSPSLFNSRSSSLAGRKRPRESDGSNATPQSSRRTKSVGDTRPRQGSSSSKDRDREAFQRGLIAVFVPKALKDSAKGEMGNYNDLLAHFLPTPTNPTPTLSTLLPLLRAISAHVSLLRSEVHGALVSAIIGLPWAHGDERFVKTFVGWAGVLVSAHPGWTKEVVQMATKGLAWQHSARTEIPTSRKVYHARHHLLISHLLSLIPTLPNLLGPILVKRFPHKREVEVVQTTWVRNMCELIGYCPELGARIWSEVVDRMLRIDVEINNNLEEEEDDDEEDDDDDIAPMSSSLTLDPFDLLTSQDLPKAATDEDSDTDDGSDVDPGDVSSADERSDEEDTQDEMKLLNQAEKKRQAVKAMREKLDGMLFWFFRHLQECMGDGTPNQSAAEMAVERMGQNGGLSSGQSTPTSEAPIHFPSAVPAITTRPTPTPAQSLAHFQTLLNLFSRQIVPTSSTQHIPFLLFLCSSFSHAHTDLFLGLLVSQALYASTTASPSVAAQPVSQAQRISATVYIGSVVCRARFVTDESARQVLTYLLAYIDGKLRQSHMTKRIDELPLFYAVCQAVMLIFCFRWRAFTTEHKEGESVLGEMELESEGEGDGEVDAEGGDGKWIKDLDVLQRAITSDLNPLLGCNTTVVNTFAKVAHHTNFAYCFSIIEANQQSTTRSSSSHSLSTQAGGSTQPKHPSASRQNSTNSASYSIPRKARQSNIDAGLDSYYPFDPFTLPRSKQYIDALYRTWGEVSIPLDESESESEEEEEEDEDSDMEDTHMISSSHRTKPMSLPKGSSWNEARRRLVPGGRDDGLSSSLEGMSISPAQAQAGFMKR